MPNQKKEATYLKLDSSKLRDALEWKPLLHFQSAVELTMNWYSRFAAGEDGAQLCLEHVDKYLALDDHASAT